VQSGLMMQEDFDSMGSTAYIHPSGMQIHRNERRSAVRLKHGNENQGTSSQMNKTTQHTVSHAAGVLLGNLHYQAEETLLREFNDSKTSGNLKSVYDMRVSHSNLARTGARQNSGDKNKKKRKHLQSAVTRSN